MSPHAVEVLQVDGYALDAISHFMCCHKIQVRRIFQMHKKQKCISSVFSPFLPTVSSSLVIFSSLEQARSEGLVHLCEFGPAVRS